MNELGTLDDRLHERVSAVMKFARAHHSELLVDLICNFRRRFRGSLEALSSDDA